MKDDTSDFMNWRAGPRCRRLVVDLRKKMCMSSNSAVIREGLKCLGKREGLL